MASAATQVVGQPVANVRLGWARVGVQQDHRLHDHAVGAVAALGGLLLDERLLDRMELTIDHQALQRGYGLGHAADGHAARPNGAIADVHGAGAALAKAAAEARAMEAQLVAEDVQQRRIVAGFDVKWLSVDLDDHPPAPSLSDITRVIPKTWTK